MAKIDLETLVSYAQSYIVRNYAAALVDRSKTAELKSYIAKFLFDNAYFVDGYSYQELTDRLFAEMAEYSILTKYLSDPNIEEININGWDDVALTYLDGSIVKADEHFFSPSHAIEKKLHDLRDGIPVIRIVLQKNVVLQIIFKNCPILFPLIHIPSHLIHRHLTVTAHLTGRERIGFSLTQISII